MCMEMRPISSLSALWTIGPQYYIEVTETRLSTRRMRSMGYYEIRSGVWRRRTSRMPEPYCTRCGDDRFPELDSCPSETPLEDALAYYDGNLCQYCQHTFDKEMDS